MDTSSRAFRIAAVAIGLLALGAALIASRQDGAEAATLSASDAVALATRYAQAPAPSGWLASAPTQANVQLSTLGAATELRGQGSLDPGTKRGHDSSRQVWLVFLRGDVAVASPAAPTQPAQTAQTYHQISVVLDASSGDLLSIGMHPPGHEVASAANLPTVALPRGMSVLVTSTPAGPTEAPLPTRVGPSGSVTRVEQPQPVQPAGPAATATPVAR